MTRRLALVFLAVVVSGCTNDYDQFMFGTGPEPKDSSAIDAPASDRATGSDSTPDDSSNDRGAATDAAPEADAAGAEDVARDAGDDRHDAEISDAGAEDVVSNEMGAPDMGPPDAAEEPDTGVVEDALPDAQDAAPDVSVGDDGGDADAATPDVSSEPDAPEDVSIDAGSDAPADARSCDSGEKSCGDHCAPLDDPATGCGEPSCSPCNLAHATARCSGQGRCIVDKCDRGFEDCDHVPENGCETSTDTDVSHCGACGRACSDAHVASVECSVGVCVSTCELGFANCERPSTGPDNGCERAVDQDSANCGSCGNDCRALGAGLTCGGSVPNLCGCTDNASCRVGGSSGVCDNSTGTCKCGPSRCRPGETCQAAAGPDVCSCNGAAGCADTETCCDLPAGCRNLSNDPASCGACGHACPAGFVCAGGACACDVDAECSVGSAGTCSAGQCVCNGVTCAPGKRCLAGGSCG